MAVRLSQAQWNGNLREGHGTMKVGAGVYEGPYSFASRFADNGGTNPEELIGAAHAGCFSMALAGDLAAAGFRPESIRTTAKVHIERAGEGWEITKIELESEAHIQDIDDPTFQRFADGAKKGCPVSKALAAVPIELAARLI